MQSSKVKKSLNEMAEKHGRKKFEYIKNFKLVTDEWTPENGLLSSSQKLKRASLVARYKVDINEMYETLVK
jgi:long-chain acyl-CoA synthetase